MKTDTDEFLTPDGKVFTGTSLDYSKYFAVGSRKVTVRYDSIFN